MLYAILIYQITQKDIGHQADPVPCYVKIIRENKHSVMLANLHRSIVPKSKLMREGGHFTYSSTPAHMQLPYGIYVE
jgi:hypothetical protein